MHGWSTEVATLSPDALPVWVNLFIEGRGGRGAARVSRILNRIDEIVTFHALGLEHVSAIVDIQLKDVQKRLVDRKLTLSLTKAAKALLAEQGFDPTFGARPLKRTIQRLVENPLAVQVLAGTYHEGDTVLVDAKDGALTFDREQVAIAAS